MSTSPQRPQSGSVPRHRATGRADDVQVSEGRISDGVAASNGSNGSNGTYNAVAVLLALIVMAALVYGLVQTSLKAAALFTG